MAMIELRLVQGSIMVGLLVILSSSLYASNTLQQNLQIISADHPLSFYCGCRFDDKQNIIGKRCPHKLDPSRVTWRSFLSVDATQLLKPTKTRLNQIGLDMQAVQPLVSEQLVLPKGYRFGLVGQNAKPGLCDVLLDHNAKIMEPPKHKKGDIARILFYLHDRYGFKLDHSEIDLLLNWQNSDPVDSWEADRNYWVGIVQGQRLNIARQPLNELLAQLESRSSIRNLQKSVRSRYVELNKLLLEKTPDFDKISFKAEWYFTLGLDIWLQGIRDGKDSAWNDLYDAYNLVSLSARQPDYKIDRNDISGFSKIMALEILLEHDEEAKWSAGKLLNHLKTNEWDEYQHAYTGLIYALARIIEEESWPSSKTIERLDEPYKSLFIIPDSEYELTARFQRSSNRLYDEFWFGSALPSEKLFQVELLAYLKLLEKYKHRTIKYKPELYSLPFMQLRAYQRYQPTSLVKKLKKIVGKKTNGVRLH